MKNILGLDLGTNSVGWALISVDENGKLVKKIRLGSRIIPMSQDVLGKFDSGVTVSQTAERTEYRSHRRLLERALLRRERLHRVLHLLGFLPEHYAACIGWDRNDNATYGKFLPETEPKLAWRKADDGEYRFIFMQSFDEMLEDFKESQPSLLANGKRIPLDWTLYYLRNKALTKPIAKEELAWILLNFNQKRGYYQLRGEEDEEIPSKRVEYHELKVVKVEATDEGKGGNIWYNVLLENGWVYRRQSKYSLDKWLGQTLPFIVTTDLEADGVTPKRDKDGNEKRSFRSPKEDDWTLVKKRTEDHLEKSGLTVGAFIYQHLLANPSDKVRGQLVRTIDRKYYKRELQAIIAKQMEFHPELRDAELLKACAEELYRNNGEHRAQLMAKDFKHLLVEDVLFYQRPLKSKKSLISNCPYETRQYINKETGEIKDVNVKCIAKSNPYFQEFRLWQWISNLRLLRQIDGQDVTADYIKGNDDKERLFYLLNNQGEIKQEHILRDFLKLKKPKGGEFPLRWNYVDDKVYPANETRHAMNKAIKAMIADKEEKEAISQLLVQPAVEYVLWNLLYSITDRNELTSALRRFALAHGISSVDAFVEAFLKVKPFKKEYGAYSEKATKKLLQVMRLGKYWCGDELPEPAKRTKGNKQAVYDEMANRGICKQTLQNISNIIEENIDERLIGALINPQRPLTALSHFQGLSVSDACYVVYGRHSEVAEIVKWKDAGELNTFINNFKQHSMRNPIVEQCVLETLRTVRDVWKQEGQIDEIHVELGRNMKRTAEQRARDTQAIQRNENTNMRISLLLTELKNDPSISDVRPYSPSQRELLKIYEEGALETLTDKDEDIAKISRLAQPSSSELRRYKLWLDQKYVSPYTGRPIPLAKLFTPAYEIEHIIPQSRYFDNSFSNKVICEAEVNKLKDNLLGMEFIKQFGGKQKGILDEDAYKLHVMTNYAHNPAKRSKLLMEDLPTDFNSRQLNDTRYISKTVMALLSNVVREEGERETRSKHVVVCTGGVTDTLKKDWGLQDVWHNLVYPRFIRLNNLTGSQNFGYWRALDEEKRKQGEDSKKVFQITLPPECQRGFVKKRIDHRHHAMDALVIACASADIVNYLNNQSAANPNSRKDLRRLVCDVKRRIRKPWPTFTQDAQAALEDLVVSFKNTVRVVNKASNTYLRYDKDGKKKRFKQEGEGLKAIRKPMHKETYYGEVNLIRKEMLPLKRALEDVNAIVDKELRASIKSLLCDGFNLQQVLANFKAKDFKFNKRDIKKVEVYVSSAKSTQMVATRKPLDTSFNAKRIADITDTGIQKILLNYLKANDNSPEQAFTPEGIAYLNEHIAEYNNGKPHQPILKVRVSEVMGAKFAVGQTGSKKTKFVEAQSGTNLYFAIYEDKDGKRNFETIALNVSAERLKTGQTPVPETNGAGIPLKFYLSPNDLVYVPTDEDRAAAHPSIDKRRIYKMVSATDKECHFLPVSVASIIADKVEFEAKNKVGRVIGALEYTAHYESSAINKIMIKDVCWKLEVDRLGNITKIVR